MINILASIDLNLLDQKPVSEIYNLLAPLRKPAFNEEDCIVFLCHSPLFKSYDDVAPDLLINLQKMLVYIDIPNYFCILKSNIDYAKDLEYVCNTYAVNESPIKLCLE